jgi:hypothetical protein
MGRLVIRAMIAFFKAGGDGRDIEKLKVTALAAHHPLVHALMSVHTPDLDPLGYVGDMSRAEDEILELTPELLTETIQLTHPDCHPPERRELAQRVTARLLALKPFVFPAPPPAKDFLETFRRFGEQSSSATPEATVKKQPFLAMTAKPCPLASIATHVEPKQKNSERRSANASAPSDANGTRGARVSGSPRDHQRPAQHAARNSKASAKMLGFALRPAGRRHTA